jgi:hypothetical protein
MSTCLTVLVLNVSLEKHRHGHVPEGAKDMKVTVSEGIFLQP